MLDLASSEMITMVNSIYDQQKVLRPSPLRFYKYLSRVLAQDRESCSITFPLTINIPKANKYMLRGDYSPEYVITLDSPAVMDDGTPMWLCTSEQQVALRFGYDNCDARQISSQKIDMEYIHSFLGGSSGHGKSVTLNSMIGAICHEYAPWEVAIHLSDAKIIEFKKYGVKHRIPHIVSIAATEDPDYVISVLDKGYQDMVDRAKIFGALGLSNLKSFRKETKLALPRVMIIMDEVESTFKNAGRLAGKLAELIDGYARLGRAAGYHLFMATQNMSSDIPSSAIGQIRNRYCLGAMQKVSEAVLGNPAASYFTGKVGMMVANTEVLKGGDTAPYNVTYQTPLIEDSEFESEMEFLEKKGQEVGYRARMNFYDEADMKQIEVFDGIIKSAIDRMTAEGELKSGITSICLGYPAFVSEDQDGLLKISLDQKDVENLIICSAVSDRVAAHLHNISKSLSLQGITIHLYTTDLDMKDYVCDAGLVLEAKNAEQPPLSSLNGLVRKRLFLLQVDKMAPRATVNVDAVETIFTDVKIPKEHWNHFLYQRYVAYSSLVKTKEWEDMAKLLPNFLNVYEEYNRYHSLVSSLTKEKLTKAAIIIGDLSKIIGYGRDSRNKHTTALKKALQDACNVGLFFVLYTRSMEDITDIVSGLRYAIFDVPNAKDWARLRVEEPARLLDNLALLNDTLDNNMPQKKFKRTLLRQDI